MENPGSPESISRLLIYAVELTGDPGAAEALLADAAARAFRWASPAGGVVAAVAAPSSGRMELLRAMNAGAHSELGNPGRPPLPPALRAAPDRFDDGIEAALAGLIGRERAALFLVLVEELSYEECAHILGTTPANAGELAWRGRRALRESLVGGVPTGSGRSEAGPPVADRRISRVIRGDCANAGPFLSAELDGELSERQRAMLDGHAGGCPMCSEERARLAQVSAAVREHWAALAGRLVTAGAVRRAETILNFGRAAASRGPRQQRLKLGMASACAVVLVALAAVWAAMAHGASDAVVGIEGPHSRRGDRIRAEGPVLLRLCDGSSVKMSAGCSLSASRSRGWRRAKVKLLAGAAEFTVQPAGTRLTVESAAGSASADSGVFEVRLAVRDAQGRTLSIDLANARALAGGEHMALLVEARTATVGLTGRSGKEVSIPPGGAGLIPASESARPLALPGTWVGLGGGGADPPVRTVGALGGDRGSGLVILFGGVLADAPGGHGERNDLWSCDPALGCWTEMYTSGDAAKWQAEWGARPPSERPNDRPAPQIPGGLLGDPRGHGLWLYGGRLGELRLAEMWFLDGTIWRRAEDYAEPAPRRAPGGKGARTPPPPPPSRPAPTGRWGAAMVSSEAAGGIVLFGGELGGRALSDAWLFDVSEGIWRPLSPRGSAPEARIGAAAATDRGGRRMYIFGGRSASGAALDDTWCLDLSALAKGGRGAEEAVAWQQFKMEPGPEGRSGAAMTCEEAAGKLVLFGGRPRLGGALSDTWLLDVSSGKAPRWSRLASPGGPGADEFAAPAMTWHPGCGTLLLLARGGLWSLRLEH